MLRFIRGLVLCPLRQTEAQKRSDWAKQQSQAVILGVASYCRNQQICGLEANDD